MSWWAVGAAVGGALLSSSMQPSGQGSTSVGPTYQPMGQPQIDQSWLQNYNQLQGLNSSYYGQLQPMAQQSLMAAYNNPYAQSYIGGAQNIAGMGQMAGAQGMGAANQIYQSSMDPQQALYNRTAQAVQQQARAANAAAGIGTSAAGVGVEDQAMNNFNIDWQNQQLQRQLQGAQGAGNANNQALNMAMGSYGLPYQDAMAVPTNQYAALQGYTGIIGAYPAALNQNMNQAANYMQLGQAAQGQAYGQAYNNQQAQSQLAGQLGQGLGQAFYNYNRQPNYQPQPNYYGAASVDPNASANWGGGNWA